MAYSAINIGNVAEDGLGDGLRTMGAKVNANFIEVYAGGSYIGGYFTIKGPNYTDISVLEVGDIIEGWADVAKTIWVKAVLENITFDLVAETGVFIISKKIKE